MEKIINSIVSSRQELIDKYSELNTSLTEKENKIFDFLMENGEKAKEKVKSLFCEVAEMREKAENLRAAINDLGNALCRFGYRIDRF